jgi:DNA-directed RNA polymerase subunit RPC12/RpoP
MYNAFYVCDRCGKQMDEPDVVLIEDRDDKHYCKDCWKEFKDQLISDNSEDVEKLKEEIDKLKKENKRLQGTVDWWNAIFISLTNEAIKQEKEKRSSSPYTAGLEGCCCENTSKDSLNYRQTTAPYFSLN